MGDAPRGTDLAPTLKPLLRLTWSLMMRCSRHAVLVAIIAMLLVQPTVGQESSKGKSSSVMEPASLDELLFFFLSKYSSGDWEPKGLRFQDVFLDSQDGTNLHGWYPKASDEPQHGLTDHDRSVLCGR